MVVVAWCGVAMAVDVGGGGCLVRGGTGCTPCCRLQDLPASHWRVAQRGWSLTRALPHRVAQLLCHGQARPRKRG